MSSSDHLSDDDDRRVDSFDDDIQAGEVVLSFNPNFALGLLVKGVTMTLLAGLKEGTQAEGMASLLPHDTLLRASSIGGRPLAALTSADDFIALIGRAKAHACEFGLNLPVGFVPVADDAAAAEEAAAEEAAAEEAAAQASAPPTPRADNSLLDSRGELAVPPSSPPHDDATGSFIQSASAAPRSLSPRPAPLRAHSGSGGRPTAPSSPPPSPPLAPPPAPHLVAPPFSEMARPQISGAYRGAVTTAAPAASATGPSGDFPLTSAGFGVRAHVPMRVDLPVAGLGGRARVGGPARAGAAAPAATETVKPWKLGRPGGVGGAVVDGWERVGGGARNLNPFSGTIIASASNAGANDTDAGATQSELGSEVARGGGGAAGVHGSVDFFDVENALETAVYGSMPSSAAVSKLAPPSLPLPPPPPPLPQSSFHDDADAYVQPPSMPAAQKSALSSAESSSHVLLTGSANTHLVAEGARVRLTIRLHHVEAALRAACTLAPDSDAAQTALADVNAVRAALGMDFLVLPSRPPPESITPALTSSLAYSITALPAHPAPPSSGRGSVSSLFAAADVPKSGAAAIAAVLARDGAASSTAALSTAATEGGLLLAPSLTDGGSSGGDVPSAPLKAESQSNDVGRSSSSSSSSISARTSLAALQAYETDLRYLEARLAVQNERLARREAALGEVAASLLERSAAAEVKRVLDAEARSAASPAPAPTPSTAGVSGASQEPPQAPLTPPSALELSRAAVLATLTQSLSAAAEAAAIATASAAPIAARESATDVSEKTTSVGAGRARPRELSLKNEDRSVGAQEDGAFSLGLSPIVGRYLRQSMLTSPSFIGEGGEGGRRRPVAGGGAAPSLTRASLFLPVASNPALAVTTPPNRLSLSPTPLAAAALVYGSTNNSVFPGGTSAGSTSSSSAVAASGSFMLPIAPPASGFVEAGATVRRREPRESAPHVPLQLNVAPLGGGAVRSSLLSPGFPPSVLQGGGGALPTRSTQTFAPPLPAPNAARPLQPRTNGGPPFLSSPQMNPTAQLYIEGGGGVKLSPQRGKQNVGGGAGGGSPTPAALAPPARFFMGPGSAPAVVPQNVNIRAQKPTRARAVTDEGIAYD